MGDCRTLPLKHGRSSIGPSWNRIRRHPITNAIQLYAQSDDPGAPVHELAGAVITPGNHRPSKKYWTSIDGRMNRISLWWRDSGRRRLNLPQIARQSVPDAARRFSPPAGPPSHTRVRIEERPFRKPRDIASALGVYSPNSSRKVCMQSRNPIEVNILIAVIAQEGNFNRAAERLRLRGTSPLLTRRTASLDMDVRCKPVRATDTECCVEPQLPREN